MAFGAFSSGSIGMTAKVTTALVAGLTVFLAAQDADAAQQRARRNAPAKQQVAALSTPTAPTVAKLTAPASARQAMPPVAVVSLNQQSVTVYSGTEIIAQSPISSGQPGYRTPTGVFSIIQKNRYHESNIYSGAPMPFMQRLTWSGIAMHAGNLPGYAASHGCVRLPYAFAERLFALTKMGARVIVAPEPTAPMVIQHASLPLPIMTRVTTTVRGPALGAGVLLASSGGDLATDAVVERTLNPMQMAELEKKRAAGAVGDAQREARTQLELAANAAAEADAAIQVRATAEGDVVNYRGLIAQANRQVALARDDEDRMQAQASLAAAEEAVGDAERAVTALRQAEQASRNASFISARRARDAEDASERAETDARIASRGTEPITIFVSRKENRVLIRQGFQALLEGDVTIRDPQAPIGTHVLTAVQTLATDTGLRWTGLAVPENGARVSTASALDRIAFDPAMASEIGRRLWTGATLIISDHGISTETGKGTDFVVLTK